jgi:hypothetical protein
MLGAEKAAIAFEKLAKDAIGEGTDQVLSAIQASAPAVDAVKKAGGTMQGTVGQQASDVFNRTGGRWKVAADTPVQYYVDKDAAGREFVNSRVLRPDGTPLVDDVHHAGLMLQDYKTRLEAQRADTNTFQTGQQIANTGKQIEETGRHNKESEKETAAYQRPRPTSPSRAWTCAGARWRCPSPRTTATPNCSRTRPRKASSRNWKRPTASHSRTRSARPSCKG